MKQEVLFDLVAGDVVNVYLREGHERAIHPITRPWNTSVRPSSIEAYSEIKSTGKTVTQAEMLRSTVEKLGGIVTRTELSMASGVPINAVCGRVNELLKAGALTETAARVECPITKKRVYGLFTQPGLKL